MENNISTIAWVLIEMKVSPNKTTDKILAECYDPQENRISWRLSSDILKVKSEGDKYIVHTKMGCVYVCNKNSEDVTKMISESIEALKESFGVSVKGMKDTWFPNEVK